MNRKIKFSEIFGGNVGDKPTFQGEGKFTGVPSVWVRFFGCNFECRGFGQKNPADPSTYEFNYPDFDFSKIKSMEEVPMITTGCDSAYSWSSKFKHLAPDGTAEEVVALLEAKLNGANFIHPKSGQDCHLVFTGGEPMLPGHQQSMADILKVFYEKKNWPLNITIETNATKKPVKAFEDCFNPRSYFYIKDEVVDPSVPKKDLPDYVPWKLFWSCSPKLYTSGEKWENAIKPEVVKEYASISNHGQLKYVCDGTDRCWDEVQRANDMYRDVGVFWPTWIMPVGADLEQQERNSAAISDEALRRGYNVASRVHCFVYGNQMGR